MKNIIVIAGFLLLAIALYVIWGSLDSKIVAIESNTGAYIETGDAEPVFESNLDVEALQRQLVRLEAALATNTETIEILLQRLDKLERQSCVGDNCTGKASRREIVYFEHNESTLSPAAKEKIDRLLQGLGEIAFVSLRGHADTSGDNTYNYLLSVRRATAVKGYIEASLGGDGGNLDLPFSIDGTGEESVITSTGDNVEEASNRAVEILIFEQE